MREGAKGTDPPARSEDEEGAACLTWFWHAERGSLVASSAGDKSTLVLVLAPRGNFRSTVLALETIEPKGRDLKLAGKMG